jgi:hypothetical protein
MPARVRERWVRDLNLDPKTGEEVSDIVMKGASGVGMKVGMILSTVYLFMGFMFAMLNNAPFPIPLIFVFAWVLLMVAITAAPRNSIKQAHERALTVPEVEALLPTARGRLERMYLNLVLDVMRQEIRSESTQADIRSALSHLGDAISKLPADPVSTQDATSLRKEALALRQQAASEHDTFIQGSLNRQAEALERRAALAAQNNRSARRAAALRREARTQIDSLRSVLVAHSQLDHASANQIGQLSDVIHRVSAEAQALAIAQRELEEEELAHLYGSPLPEMVEQTQPQRIETLPVAQEIVQQVGQNGGTPTTPTASPASNTPPQPQTAATRQWWRGGNVG